MAAPEQLQERSPTVWELPVSYKQGMRVPAQIIATRSLVEQMDQGVYDQEGWRAR